MKSACRVPIRLSSCDALTPPRGVPAAVSLDHHHSSLPLHLVAVPLGRRHVLLCSGGRCGSVVLSPRKQRPCSARRLVGDRHGHEPRWLAFKQGSTTPWVTYLHKATSSFRASATIV